MIEIPRKDIRWEKDLKLITLVHVNWKSKYAWVNFISIPIKIIEDIL